MSLSNDQIVKSGTQGQYEYDEVSSNNTQSITRKDKTRKNPNYSSIKAWSYALIQATGGFYFGYSMTCLNNLGGPVVKHHLGITDPNEYIKTLGSLSLVFGIGKVIGSQLAGSLANKFGRKNCLIVSELANIASLILICYNSEFCFILGRALVGIYLGFVTCLSPRMILECYPNHKRGTATTIFAFNVTIGVWFSFSMGKFFGEALLIEYWFQFLAIPAVLSFTRMVLILIFYNHETPHQQGLWSRDWASDNQAITKVLMTFYDDIYEIEAAEKELEKASSKLDNDDQTFMKMLKYNVFNKKTRFSQLAVIFLNIYTPLSGQAFTDNYSVIVFDKIGGEGFGYEVSFYSGILVVVGGLLALLLVKKIGLRLIWLYGGAFMLLIGMYLLSLGFFMNTTWICQIGIFVCNFSIYFGHIGTYATYVNELAEPFVVGLGIAVAWTVKSIVSYMIPFSWNALPDYWTPAIFVTIGIFLFVLIRPLYIEIKGKTLNQIRIDYSRLEYRLCAR